MLGRISVFHRGGASRKRCSSLDNFRRVQSFAMVCRVFKESLRSSFTALILYYNGLFSFITSTESVSVGDTVYSGYLPKDINFEELSWVFLRPGSALPLEIINLFNLVHNIELFALSGFKLAKAAGSSAVLSNKILGRCFLKLSSG